MNIKMTSCCAIADINGLSSYVSAKNAMIAFCQQVLLKPVKFGSAKAAPDSIYSFYLFSAAIGPYYKPYGKEFSAFITENELGEVYESKVRPNKAFHGSRGNQVYIWTPELDAIKAWWARNDPSTSLVPPKYAPQVIGDDRQGENGYCDCDAELNCDGACPDGCEDVNEDDEDDEKECGYCGELLDCNGECPDTCQGDDDGL